MLLTMWLTSLVVYGQCKLTKWRCNKYFTQYCSLLFTILQSHKREYVRDGMLTGTTSTQVGFILNDSLRGVIFSFSALLPPEWEEHCSCFFLSVTSHGFLGMTVKFELALLDIMIPPWNCSSQMSAEPLSIE